MTGTLAETIQGEAGSNPAAQFAVASTIYNRQQAGSFPGGTDPTAIVNAPNQFTGYNANPNSTADMFAAAVQNGTLSNYGNPGNATYFQSGQPAFDNGLNYGTNVGGNYFSDNFGAPSSDFTAPTYTGMQPAAGIADSSSGLSAGTSAYNSNQLDTPALDASGLPTQAMTDANAGIPSSINVTPENSAFTGGSSSSGCTATSAILGSIGNTFGLSNSGCSVGQAITTSATAFLQGIESWFVRSFLIILGIVLIGVAAFALLGRANPRGLPVPV